MSPIEINSGTCSFKFKFTLFPLEQQPLSYGFTKIFKKYFSSRITSKYLFLISAFFLKILQPLTSKKKKQTGASAIQIDISSKLEYLQYS